VTTEQQQLKHLERGRFLSEPHAQAIESRLLYHPKFINLRLQLIGYYWKVRTDEEKLFHHLQWFITNRPSSKLWRLDHNIMCLRIEWPDEWCASSYELWKKQFVLHENSASIRGNAGLCLIRKDYPIASQLLSEAMASEPGEADWPEWLAVHSYMNAKKADSTERKRISAITLNAGAQYIKTHSIGARQHSEVTRRMLSWCAQSAYWIDDYDLARHYALREIEVGKTYDVPPKTSYSILGLIALHSGDVAAAIDKLISSGHELAPDFWDLELAKLLLLQGQAQSVITYFDDCKKQGFWKGKVDLWLSAIKEGRNIEFSEN
jgi:hypothetical protein